MQYSRLGSSGLIVSRICLGTATLGVAPQEAEAVALVRRALDLGITFFDTANSYGNQPRFDRPGVPPADRRRSAEEILGQALRGRRHEVVLASKVSEAVGPGANDRGLSRRHIIEQVEQSLRRLQTDYLDLYYAHHPDPDTAPEHTLRAFDDLIRQGKVRHGALSTFPAWQLVQILKICGHLGLAAPVAHQVPYSLASRDAMGLSVETEILPACARLGLGVTVASPLAGGLLAGAAILRRPVAGRQRFGDAAAGYTPRQVRLAERLEELARSWGHLPAQLALAWVLSRSAVASALTGAESSAELERNAGSTDIRLTADQAAQLDELGRAIG